MEDVQVNKTRDFVKAHEGDNKLDKGLELNESMTIETSGKDEYENKIKNIGGR